MTEGEKHHWNKVYNTGRKSTAPKGGKRMIKAEDVWANLPVSGKEATTALKDFLNQVRQEQQEADIRAVVDYFAAIINNMAPDDLAFFCDMFLKMKIELIKAIKLNLLEG